MFSTAIHLAALNMPVKLVPYRRQQTPGKGSRLFR